MKRHGRSETYDRKAGAGDLSHRCIPMLPCMAPHTAEIHTLITLGVRHCAKPRVFKLRTRRPIGFDSHRPLHFQPAPAKLVT
jgi:hypothetical protein